MPKITKKLSIVSLFVLVIGLFAGTALVRRVQELRKEAAPPAPNVFISPANQTESPDAHFTFYVMSDTGNFSISGLDLFINYDPSVFEIQEVIKGPGISSFSEWINQIDNTKGEISYTATTQNLSELVSGSNVHILEVQGKIRPGVETGTYDLSFGNTSSLVDGNGDDIRANTGPGTISVLAGPTPTAQPVGNPLQERG